MVKRLLFSIISLALLACVSEQSFAQDRLYLGYCDGLIANGEQGNVQGITGNNTKITEAIRIPGTTLAGYVGQKIAGVHAGIPASSSLPSAISGAISSTKGGAPLKSATLSGPDTGWCDIMFDEPYTITGQEQEIWVSFSFVQSKKLNIISFVGDTNADGCWIGKNTSYTDYSSKNLGSLSVEAIITGDNLPTHDLELVSAKTAFSLNEYGSPIKVDAVIRNSAFCEAVNPIIECSVNGQPALTYTYPGTLQYRDRKTVRLEIPSDVVTEDGPAQIDLNIKWADGSVDDNAQNNQYSFIANMVEQVVYRVSVAEEASGAWCGYCVRGIVGMKYMRETYPDQFIGIAVHNGDSYVVSTYDSWIGTKISGYPSALFNRDGKVYDPAAAKLEAALLAVDTYANCKLTFSANLVEDNSSKIAFHVDAKFLTDETGTNYNLAFVVLEDQLPISQSNYYSGGSMGAMGGFESMPNPCSINIDDVARGIYPSTAGVANVIPADIVRGEVYSYDYEITRPTIANGDNVWAAVLLINANNGHIEQAAKVPYIGGLSGIQQVAVDEQTVDAGIFDLQGRQLQNQPRGLSIQNGRVVLVK